MSEQESQGIIMIGSGRKHSNTEGEDIQLSPQYILNGKDLVGYL